MKRFYLFMWSICVVLITVLFFQLLTWIYVQVPMFTKRVNIQLYLVTVLCLSFFAWVFITVWISKFSSSNDMDDDFDL